MSGGRLFTTATNDQMIFGQEMVTMLSVTLIAVILHWTMTSFKNDYSLTASNTMRIPCLISMIMFLLMNIVGMIGWNNVFIPISSATCKVIYPFCLLCYNFGKISMYYLFTFRIQLIFQHTDYQVSVFWLNVYRFLCLTVPTILWCIWIYLSWSDITPHETQSNDPQYQYCFPQHFKYNELYLAEHISFSIGLCDFLFSGIALCLFIFKYYQITSLYHKTKIMTNINDNGDLYSALSSSFLSRTGFELKHLGIIRKSTMLVMVAVFSTWLFLIGQAYVLRQLGFYLPFDGVVNSLCIACLFQFGDDFYNITFGKLECCCLCFGLQCSSCNCLCCCSYDDDEQKQDSTAAMLISSSPSVHDDPHEAQRLTVQYHAKIHSYTNGADKGGNLKAPTKQAGAMQTPVSSFDAAGSTRSKINIGTPSQRHNMSPEHKLLFSKPRSITEFIPLNLKEEREEFDTAESDAMANHVEEQEIDSGMTASVSDFVQVLQPANRTGAIPVIAKYNKPSKISKF